MAGDQNTVRPMPTNAKAWEVLQNVKKGLDASIGSNCELLDCYAASLSGGAGQAQTFEQSLAAQAPSPSPAAGKDHDHGIEL
jgi:hypothetical protein